MLNHHLSPDEIHATAAEAQAAWNRASAALDAACAALAAVPGAADQYSRLCEVANTAQRNGAAELAAAHRAVAQGGA